MHLGSRFLAVVLTAFIAWLPAQGSAQSSISDAQLDGLAKMYRDGRAKYEELVQKANAGDVESQYVLGAALYDKDSGHCA